jgi:NAD(P)-dependent dehydrogenase (short-subunit alcohol dehydrogenase family)
MRIALFAGGDMSPERKVVLITGGGTGVGKSAAVKLAKLGYAVVVVGRTQATLDEAKREVEAVGGMVLTYACDAGDYKAVQEMVKFTLQKLGRIDVLVNSAGVGGRKRSVATVEPEDVERVLRINLMGPMFCCQAVLPDMLKRGEGTIVNVSSLAAYTPGPLSGPVYAASKAGLNNFNEYINVELRNTGVRACVVVPGEIDTPILDKRPIPPSKAARAAMMTADDVAEAVVLAITMPQRTLIEEVKLRPTMVRDRSREVPPLKPLLNL